jgi:hypothetical protein
MVRMRKANVSLITKEDAPGRKFVLIDMDRAEQQAATMLAKLGNPSQKEHDAIVTEVMNDPANWSNSESSDSHGVLFEIDPDTLRIIKLRDSA